MQTLSFVPINLHRCSPRERKHSIQVKVSAASLELARIHARSTRRKKLKKMDQDLLTQKLIF